MMENIEEIKKLIKEKLSSIENIDKLEEENIILF